MRLVKGIVLLVVLGILALVFYPTLKRGVERVFYPLEYTELIDRAAGEHDLDPYLVAAIIFEESKFDPAVRSKAGAVGLMQIMPETGRWVAAQQGESFDEKDLVKPAVNIDIGSWYLRYLKGKLENEDLALAAYNGGLDNVDKWMRLGEEPSVTLENIPFRETREYVERVKASRTKYRELYPDIFN
ncbi:MAG: lytic transglycosylase domain-containing protein [Candidatus Aquicultorales bacterium]